MLLGDVQKAAPESSWNDLQLEAQPEQWETILPSCMNGLQSTSQNGCHTKEAGIHLCTDFMLGWKRRDKTLLMVLSTKQCSKMQKDRGAAAFSLISRESGSLRL